MFESKPIEIRFTKQFTNTAPDWYKDRTKYNCHNDLHVARYPVIDFKHKWSRYKSLFGIEYRLNMTAYQFMNNTASQKPSSTSVVWLSNTYNNYMSWLGEHNLEKDFSGRSYDVELWITVNKTTFPLIDDSVKRQTQFLVPVLNNLDPKQYIFSSDGKTITIKVPRPVSPFVDFSQATAKFTDTGGPRYSAPPISDIKSLNLARKGTNKPH